MQDIEDEKDLDRINSTYLVDAQNMPRHELLLLQEELRNRNLEKLKLESESLEKEICTFQPKTSRSGWEQGVKGNIYTTKGSGAKSP